MIKLTDEQKLVLNTDENIIIKAAAGSGKTTLLHHYIKTIAPKKRVLYLAFNKSVKEEAERKFKDVDHLYLDIRTAHSLAFEAIVSKNKYKVGFLNAEDVMKECAVTDYILVSHITRVINLYCSGSIEFLKDVDYKSTLTNEKSQEFVDLNYDVILNHASDILLKMQKGTIDITHDYYLKLFQLSKPVLNFDYILFDEGQDASEVMLDIFRNQTGIKVIVGDSHQQIYAWRNAINSLEKFDYPQYPLSESFRFNQSIANLAINAIKWKGKLLGHDTDTFHITGAGKDLKKVTTKAFICRTNMKLIDFAIEKLILEKTVKHIYFEGGFKNYTINNVYMYVNDILALKNGQTFKIKNKRLKHLESISDLREFINETEDGTLEQALKMVEAYGRDLPEYIEKLKLAETPDKSHADIILTTVHKAKGCEYDDVTVMDDFNDRRSLSDDLDNCTSSQLPSVIKNINEEINILYVAITRSKGILHLPANIGLDLDENYKNIFYKKEKGNKNSKHRITV